MSAISTAAGTALSRTGALLDRVAIRIEGAAGLDPAADAIQRVTALLRPGTVKDLLSGTAAGHPVHPVAVMVPLGIIGSAVLLDVVSDDAAAVRTLTVAGLLGAVPAVATGWSDWNETQGAERRVGLVHAVGNAVGLGLVGASLLCRRPTTRRALSVAGLGVLGGAGWLGGHLAYALGVGVDTTAFQRPPTDWTDVCAEHEVLEIDPLGVVVDGFPVVLLRHDGKVVALADRCTHRGAPLHEGSVVDGCLECPWHATRFDVMDGSVVRGPATRPQPTFAVRSVAGRVEVRRDEERTLRLNPVS